MIKVFYGENRILAHEAIVKFLGPNYEVIEGVDLMPSDLPNIFWGTSLFSDVRSILIRDLSSNKVVYDKLPTYLETPHKIALFELKLDKRSAAYKTLKDKIEFKEFTLPKPDAKLIFDIYRVAKNNGPRAIALLSKIENGNDPIMFFGLLVSNALRDLDARQGIKEKRVLEELSRIDLEIKSTSLSPWLSIESFLLRLSSL